MTKILIADDELAILMALELALLAAGYEVVTAADGEDAFQKICESADADSLFDILVTDVQMPIKTGDELIRDVVARYPDIGVVAMTGYGDRETIVSLMKAGCREFVDKPFKAPEIIDAVKKLVSEQEHRRELVHDLIADKERENERLTNVFTELQQQVKKAVVSYSELIAINHDSIPLPFYEKIRPLTDVGGDLLATGTRPDGTIAVLVADVAGHDLSASYHALLMKTLFTKYCESVNSPTLFFQSVNSVLLSTDNERMITAQLLLVNREKREYTVTSAGHPPALYWSRPHDAVSFVEASGHVVGVLDGVSFEEVTASFTDGDQILMYTDGVVELRRTDGASGRSIMLSPDGLKELFADYTTLPLTERVDAIWEDAQEFCRYKINDDLLMVAVELQGEK